MLYKHGPVGVIEGVVFYKVLKGDLVVGRLSLFQLFNIRLPLEIPFLETELFDRNLELFWG